MTPALLPGKLRLKIVQSANMPTRRDIDAVEHLLVVVPDKPVAGTWRVLPHGGLLEAAFKRAHKHAGPVAIATVGLPGKHGGIASVARAGPGKSAFALHTLVRRVLAETLSSNPVAVDIVVAGFDSDEAQRVYRAFALCALTAAAPEPSARSRKPKARRLRTLRLFGPGSKFDLKPLRAECEGAALTRWLGALPPNVLSASGYRNAVEQLAGAEGWKHSFFGVQKLRKLGAGAFLSVAQASPAEDSGIVLLQYRPQAADKSAKPVALVGKGIVFDTGGINLKPFKSMRHMHEDMLGSAVALGTLLALTRLRFAAPVDCWLAIAENHIGNTAYKPHDIVTACNGTTIEVVHTDAEGRMVLADTLVLAGREKPRVIIDFATLTGACVNALSERYSGVFTNRATWHDTLVANGADCGERVWPFPLDADFDAAISSTVADVLQCSADADADHILAARFLKRFVPKSIPWLHMDLSSARHKDGLGHVATDLTGFGVRYTLALLARENLGLPDPKK